MLKKAGIVVAMGAAGLLAVSPLAFAGDKHDHNNDHDGKKKVKVEDVNHVDDSKKALINFSDNDAAFNYCSNGDIESFAVQDLVGALAIFGEATTDESEEYDCKQGADAGDSVKQKYED
ncbi:hypothetical protein GCM10009609_62160 [Pseudonocardia aurantiaca]|uniref:Uncharacterized protein n=1 Tax=Pseudonocardia aurantiaca TaxID=75290 RepID=A0ABW4FUH0_9PSEU